MKTPREYRARFIAFVAGVNLVTTLNAAIDGKVILAALSAAACVAALFAALLNWRLGR